LQLCDINEFKISAPQHLAHYPPVGNVDVLDIVANTNIRVSRVSVSDILDSDQLHLLDHITTKQLLQPQHLQIGNGFKIQLQIKYYPESKLIRGGG
jgi:hypothetical protein